MPVSRRLASVTPQAFLKDLKLILCIVGTIIFAVSAGGCFEGAISADFAEHFQWGPPIKVANTGSEISDTEIQFIQPRVTTRAEVIQKLGQPNMEMPELGVIAYVGEEDNGIALGIAYGGAAQALFVAFDQNNRVIAYKLEKDYEGLSGQTPIQEAARDWIKSRGKSVPSLPSRFVEHDVPPGQALLYIYRSVSFFEGAPPRLLVDGKVQAELKGETYLAITQPLGIHRVTVVPEGVAETRESRSISLEMTPNRKYFISIRVPLTTAPVEISPQSEQEAMPVLEGMTPAR